MAPCRCIWNQVSISSTGSGWSSDAVPESGGAQWGSNASIEAVVPGGRIPVRSGAVNDGFHSWAPQAWVSPDTSERTDSLPGELNLAGL